MQDGHVAEISPAFYEIIGATGQEQFTLNSHIDLHEYMSTHVDLRGKDIAALRESETAEMLALMAERKFQTTTWNVSLKSGRKIRFKNKYTPTGHLVMIVKDMTEEVERERLLNLGLQMGTSGYWSYHFASKRSVLSEYITNKLSANEIERAQADGLFALVHPDDAERVDEQYEAAVQGCSEMDCCFRLQTENNGVQHIRLIGKVEALPASGEADVFIAFINDLTDDENRQKELEAAKELSQSRSNFLTRMSHEIKTPLNAIIGMTEALLDEVDNDEARETVGFISAAAENLNTILSQTLMHERMSISEIILDEDVVNIGTVAKSVVALWKQPCENKRIGINLRLSPELPNAITIDNSRFRQCLTNLISNAVKFTMSGDVTVAIAPMGLGTSAPKLVVAVKDTGIGMNADAIEKLFKPFQQANPAIRQRFGGSGLGMSITQHIVDAMDGSIKVQSVEGEGSTIAIVIPLNPVIATQDQGETSHNQDAPIELTSNLSAPVSAPQISTLAPTPIAAPTPTAPLIPTVSVDNAVVTPPVEAFHPTPLEPVSDQPEVRKNVAIVPSDYSGFDVLVVEDNPINQVVVKKLLHNHITSMTFAFNGQEALDILETKSFDVILMDIHMPVKDGIETTLEIRNSGKPWADTVIVALTADPDYQQKRVCRNIGMNDALSKPVKRQELLDVMQKVLDERVQSHSEQVSQIA